MSVITSLSGTLSSSLRHYPQSSHLDTFLYFIHSLLLLFFPSSFTPASYPSQRSWHWINSAPPRSEWMFFKWSAQFTTKQKGYSSPVVPTVLISPLVLQSCSTLQTNPAGNEISQCKCGATYKRQGNLEKNLKEHFKISIWSSHITKIENNHW